MQEQELVKRSTLTDWELARRQSELERLEEAIALREAALAAYRAELDDFHRRYAEALARPQAELLEIEARAAEVAARLRPEDATKRRKAERLRAEAEGRARPVPAPEAPARPKPADELRKLFRELTKLAHPDLAADPAERAHRETLMIQVNAAYAEGDAGALAYLLGKWQAGTVESDDAEAKLDRVMRRIAEAEARLRGKQGELEGLQGSDWAQLMRRAQLAEREGRDLFAKFVAAVEDEKRQALKRLKTFERRLAKLEDERKSP